MTGSPRGGLAVTLEMIKFQHTVFALPFALTGMVLAARGLPPARTLLWVVLAMVGARSAAMAFNRIVDRAHDALNPRTAGRPLAAGKLSVGFARWFTLGSVILFVVSAGMLNPLCLWLSPLALAISLGYSYTKRFTSASHLVLGLSLGIAPIGGYIAVSGHFTWTPLLLMAAVLTWTAGFDVLYALQDVEFDRAHGLHSIPARLGPARALHVAAGLHLLAVVALAMLLPVAGLGWIYGAGVVMIAGLLLYEHAIISPDDLSRLGIAFFRVNAAVSILVFAFTLADLLVPLPSVA